jgi:hypothetical protein
LPSIAGIFRTAGANSGTSELGRAQYIEHVNLGFPGSVALHLEDPQSVTGNERFLSCWPDELNTCFAQLISELAISPRFNDFKRVIPRAG